MRCSLTLVVMLLARAATAQPAPQATLTQELRLDASAEDFPVVTRVYIGPRDQMALPLLQDMRLRVYDSSGKRLATVGGRGEGPGEFRHLSAIGWLGDTLWVNDGALRRTTLLGPDFRVLKTTRWTWTQDQPASRTRIAFFDPVVLTSDGEAVGYGRAVDDGVSGRDGVQRSVLVRLGRNSEARVILTLPDSRSEPWSMHVRPFSRPIPFALAPQFAFGHDGTRVGVLAASIPKEQNSSFRVTLLNTHGDTIFSRDYPFVGERIPRQAIDSALASFSPPPGRPSEEPPDLPQRFQALARQHMSAWYIPAETIVLGLDGTIWIGMRPTIAGRAYLVLTSRGEPIGTVSIPRSSRVRQARATHIWVTDSDANGLVSVARYRVSGLACGPAGC